VLFLAISWGHMIGVMAAALAAVSGRLCANTYLFLTCRELKRSLGLGLEP